MKITSFVAIVLALAVAHQADARPRPEGGIHGKRFEANKTFGLGIELGEPTGLTGKYYLAADHALDFGIGDVYNYYDYRGVYLYMDYLWHPISLASAEDFELPFYVGVGGAFWSWEDYRTRVYDHGDALGVRVPVGIAFDFNNVPIDIFVQIVPTLDFFFNTPSGYDRSLYLIFEGSLGIRYYFN